MNSIIKTVDDLKELACRIKNHNAPIAVDTETNGLFPIEDKIVGWSLAFSETEGYYIPRNHRYSDNVPDFLHHQLFELLQKKHLIWHNGKFDIEFIKTNFGLEMPIYSDTMVMAYLSCFKKLALKEIMSSLFHYETKEFDQLLAEKYGKQWKSLGYTAADLTDEDIADYAIHDVLYTYKLFNLLKDEMANYKSIFKVELNLVPIVAKMNLSGITIDSPKLRALAQEAHQELDKRFDKMQVDFNAKTAEAKKLSDANGGVPFVMHPELGAEKGIKSLTELYNTPFNPNSPYQVRAILLEGFGMPVLKRTEKSAISTDAEVLEQYVDMGCDFAKQLVEYRSLNKYITNYLDKIPEICSHTDKLYASFNQMGAESGRFSCPSSSNWEDEDRTVNLQNQPRDDNQFNIRTCYVAPEGYTWVKADYKQQEYRAMCNIAGEQSAIEQFRAGVDFHTATARMMFDIPDDQEVSKELRNVAKCVTGDTLIYSPSKGLVRIDSLSDFRKEDQFIDIDCDVVDMNGSVKEASQFYYGGEKKVTNIVTRYGYKLSGSTDKHMIMVLNETGRPEYKKVSDITTSDYVLLYRGGISNNTKYTEFTIDPSWVYKFSVDHEPENDRDAEILSVIEKCHGIRHVAADILGMKNSQVVTLASKYNVPHSIKGRPYEFLINTITEDVAELWGMLLSDGHFQDKKNGCPMSTYFCTADKENIDRFVELCSKIWPDYDPYVDYRPTVNGVDFWVGTINSRFVTAQFSMGHYGQKGVDLPFPKEILSAPNSVKAAFLTGWFNGDGCFLKNEVNTASISKDFIVGMQQCLLSMGILSDVASETPTTRRGTDYLVWKLCIVGDKSHRLFEKYCGAGLIKRKHDRLKMALQHFEEKPSKHILAYNMKQFVEEAMPGLTLEQRKNKYRHLNKGVNSYSMGTLRDIYVSSSVSQEHKDYIGHFVNEDWIALPVKNVFETVEPVYDLFVPDGNQFIANGFINHNTVNFGLNYGMGVDSLSKRINRTAGETKQLYDKYFEKLPHVKALSNWAHDQVEQTEMIKTYFGRVRKLEWKDQGTRRADMIKNSGFNTMIQGTCADITKIAMLRVKDRVLDKYPEDIVSMKLQVHDELDFIVRNDMLDEVCAKIKNAMTIPTPENWVDFEVDVEIGKSWSELDHEDWTGDFVTDTFTGWGDIMPKKYQSYLTEPEFSATW